MDSAHVDLAQRQGDRRAGVRHVQHVAAAVAHEREQARQRAGRVAEAHPQREVARRRRPCRAGSRAAARNGSMLPPDSTATTGVANRCGYSISAATPAAPGGLDDQLRPLEAVQQRPRQRVLADGDDVVDQRRHLGERDVARTADRDAVGDRAHRRQGDRHALGQRDRPRRGPVRLHPDHGDVRPQRPSPPPRCRRAARRRRCRPAPCARPAPVRGSPARPCPDRPSRRRGRTGARARHRSRPRIRAPRRCSRPRCGRPGAPRRRSPSSRRPSAAPRRPA